VVTLGTGVVVSGSVGCSIFSWAGILTGFYSLWTWSSVTFFPLCSGTLSDVSFTVADILIVS
jgi:hypothetical protein